MRNNKRTLPSRSCWSVAEATVVMHNIVIHKNTFHTAGSGSCHTQLQRFILRLFLHGLLNVCLNMFYRKFVIACGKLMVFSLSLRNLLCK